MLTFMNDTVMIKEVPTEKTPNNKILVAPIIEHIKKVGKLVHFKDISYISYKDKMKVCVGVDPIDKGYGLPVSDLDQSMSPLQIHLMVADVQQVSSYTINNQIFPTTNIKNTKIVNNKSEPNEDSQGSAVQSPEDNDEEFTPTAKPKAQKAKTVATALP